MPLRSLLHIVLIGLCLAGCGYIPRPVEGVPPGLPWQTLPLQKWLAEDRAEPLALSFCAPPECTPGLAVAVLRLTGTDAREAEAVLDNPSALARALEARPAKPPAKGRKPVRTRVAAQPLQDGSLRGFAISLAPAGGGKPPAYGAALGRRMGDALEVVLAIGTDPDTVAATARRVAERELRP